MRSALPLLFLLFVGACSSPRPSPSAEGDAAEDGSGAVLGPDSLVRRIYEFGMGFGESRSAIRESLGEPAEVEVALAENRHVPSATDSLITLVYEGLRFELIRPGPVERDLVTSVILTDRATSLPGGVGIGTPRAELTRRLGAPEDRRSDPGATVLAYRVPGLEVDEFVEFTVRGDTVRSIRWIPYVD